MKTKKNKEFDNVLDDLYSKMQNAKTPDELSDLLDEEDKIRKAQESNKWIQT